MGFDSRQRRRRLAVRSRDGEDRPSMDSDVRCVRWCSSNPVAPRLSADQHLRSRRVGVARKEHRCRASRARRLHVPVVPGSVTHTMGESMTEIFAIIGFLAAASLVAYVGYLTLSHGWGWVLAQWNARKQRIETDAAAVFSAQWAGLTAPLTSTIAVIEADVAALKTRVGL